MPLNNTGLVFLANTLRSTLLYAQLHSDLAGSAGISNLAIPGRQPVNWAIPDSDGDFGLASQISFPGGVPGDPVYSVTLWDAETAGVFYGEFALAGDAVFSASGEYLITAIDVTGTSA